VSNQLAIIPPSELVRQSSDIAGLCREIVVATAIRIGPNSYVKVEGWLSIATAHGCIASAKDVHKVEGGIVATGELRRMQDGSLLCSSEGFVGDDEPMWAKRPEYARRAMAQTRAISRVCRSAFAHVVVLMNAGLSTTPAEEVPDGGFSNEPEAQPQPKTEPPASALVLRAKKLQGVEKFTGEKNGKPWVRWGLTIVGGGQCGTFDEKLAIKAEVLHAGNSECDMVIKPGRKEGTFDLVSIEQSDDIPA